MKHVGAEARGGGERGYWDRTVEQYQPTPSMSRRKDHRIGKEGTPECLCQQQEEQSGRYVVERCTKLVKVRGGVEEEIAEWWKRHSGDRKRKKLTMWVEKEREREEGEKMETFFCSVYEILMKARNFDVTNSPCNNSTACSSSCCSHASSSRVVLFRCFFGQFCHCSVVCFYFTRTRYRSIYLY